MTYNASFRINTSDWFKITRPPGYSPRVIYVKIGDNNNDLHIGVGQTSWPAPYNAYPDYSDTFTLDAVNAHRFKYMLDWSNCYSFGNGVESNRITDTFNAQQITPGVRVSTVFEDYKEEHRKYGLIYSGLYNSISGVNNLNQFIQAEKITKDINPTYGSIQKLHTRDTDLVTLCEDKVLRILASKDAVYNADGNPQLTATNRVLGQTVPFVGEFGISKNPESFTSEAYRAYFTDKVRGSVMRLSKDGLTPISMHGMKDWFRDNLKLGNKYLLGSYDDKKDDYNLTIKGDIAGKPISTTVSFSEDVRGWVSFKSFVPENAISMANDYYTMHLGKIYEHHVEEGVGRNAFYGGGSEKSSIKFLLNDSPEIVKTFNTLNYEGSQSKIDQFTTETVNSLDPITNAAISTTYNDSQYYNLSQKPGWYVENIQTDLQNGSIPEFIKKEGKWFNYIRGKDININDFGQIDSTEEAQLLQQQDSAEISFQGIGILKTAGTEIIWGCTECGTFWETQNPGSYCDGVGPATTAGALNFNPLANHDDGNCTPTIYGCNDDTVGNNPNINGECHSGPNATSGCSNRGCCGAGNGYLSGNFDPSVNTLTSCIYYGCTTPGMYNSNTPSGANTNIPSLCTPFIYGCMTSQKFNTAGTANTACSGPIPSSSLPGSGCLPPNCTGPGNNECCEDIVEGCTNPNMCHYDSLANTDDGSCASFITPGCVGITGEGGFEFGPDMTNNLNTYTQLSNTGYPTQLEFKQTSIIAPEFTFSLTTTPPPQPGISTTTTATVVPANTSVATANQTTGTIVDPVSQNENGLYKIDWELDFGIASTPSSCIYTCDKNNGALLEYNVILGCMDPAAYASGTIGYNPNATIDDGSCIPYVDGCMELNGVSACGEYWEAQHPGCYCNDTQKWDGTSCSGDGSSATTEGAFNFDIDATRDDDSCTDTPCSVNVTQNCGCDDENAVAPSSTNTYGSLGPCTYTSGCMDQGANNFAGVGSTTIPPANDPALINTLGTYNGGPCTYDGCLTTYASNYDPTASVTVDDESCIIPGCYDTPSAMNNDCATVLYTDPLTGVYTAPTSPCTDGVTEDDGYCVPLSSGCLDPAACNHAGTENRDCGGNLPASGYGDTSCCTEYGCQDLNANNFNNNAGCDSTSTNYGTGPCTYTLAAPVISILPAPSTGTGASGLTLENSSLWSSPIFNRIAVSWEKIDGAVGYEIEYKHIGESTWESIDLPETPSETVPYGFGYANEGDYLYILDDTIIPVNNDNLITNTWASGELNPDEYDIRVSQKFDSNNGTEPSTTQIAGFVHNETTVPGTTISGTSHGANVSNQLNHINFITPVDNSTLDLNLTSTAVNTNQTVTENGVEKQIWNITYTWAKLPVPTSTIVFIFKYPDDNIQLLGGPGSVYDTYSQASQQSGGVNTFVRTIKIPRYTGTHTITAYLKLGFFTDPTAGTGCHKPPTGGYTSTVTQSANNTNDLFYCKTIVANFASEDINTD